MCLQDLFVQIWWPPSPISHVRWHWWDMDVPYLKWALTFLICILLWSISYSPSFKLIVGFCWPKFSVLALTACCELSLNLVLQFCSSDRTLCHIQSLLILGFSHKQETKFLFFISSINAGPHRASRLILKWGFWRMTHLRISQMTWQTARHFISHGSAFSSHFLAPCICCVCHYTFLLPHPPSLFSVAVLHCCGFVLQTKLYATLQTCHWHEQRASGLFLHRGHS